MELPTEGRRQLLYASNTSNNGIVAVCWILCGLILSDDGLSAWFAIGC